MTNTDRISLKPRANRIGIRELQNAVDKESNRILLFTLLHLPLGLLLYAFGSIGIIHPLAVFALGMYWAISPKAKIEWVVYVVGYLIGCEVLWRMAEIPVFWEFGKYGSSAIMITALVRRGKYNIPILAKVFIVLLIPACLWTVLTVDLKTAREQISFNLSGPFCLFVCCWFFSNITFTKTQIRRLLLSIFVPLLTIATTTFLYTASLEEIQFTNESNFATSGGFGPNQVSSVLGLGVFIGLACYFLYNEKFKFKLYFTIGAIFLATQSLLTFSRGGIYNALGALAILVLIQFQNLPQTLKKIAPIFIAGTFFLMMIFPYMNNFTGGKLEERFEDTGTTRRTDIIQSDFQILQENPFLGVGLGNAKEYREKFLGYEAASHTEFSRLISEHGIFGILAIISLVLMALFNFLRQDSVFGRALIAGAILWCCLFMFNAGMRLAAPGFFWGLGFINIVAFQPELRKKFIK